LLNVLSDSFGIFVDLALTPFIKFMVKEEELEDALGFSQATNQSFLLVAGFIGSFLILMVSLPVLAIINAGTFFVAAVLIRIFNRPFATIEDEMKLEKKSQSFKAIWQHISAVIKELVTEPSLRVFLIILVLLNGIGNAVSALAAIYFANHSPQQFINIAYSVMIFNGVAMGSNIFGAMLGSLFLKNLKTHILVPAIFIGFAISFTAIATQNIWLGLYGVAISLFLCGVLNPRINALFMKQVPTEKLATLTAGIGTFSMLIPACINFVITALAGILGAEMVSGFLVIVAVIALIAVQVLGGLKEEQLRFETN
jgi:hypothetical protein